MDKATRSLILKAKDFLSERGHWTQNTFAVAKNGKEVTLDKDDLFNLPEYGYDPGDPSEKYYNLEDLKIIKACAIGALIVANDFKNNFELDNAISILAENVRDSKFSKKLDKNLEGDEMIVMAFNDAVKKKETVVKLFDKALSES